MDTGADFDTAVLGLALPAGVEDALRQAGAHRGDAPRAMAALMRALVAGAAALGLPAVWREVPREALPGARHDARTRFYLFALKGYAYLSLRLDDAIEARDALALLRALDPQDCVGGALLEGVRLAALHDDPDAEPAPYIAAARLPEHWLRALMHDADLQVRLQVAARLQMPTLWRMAQDPAPEVRRVLATRLPVAMLETLAADPDWTVRWEAAGRATGAVLARLRHDPEAEVRERAAERLGADMGAKEPAHG